MAGVVARGEAEPRPAAFPLVGALGNSLGISDTVLTVWRFAKWPALIALVLLIFGTLYYTSPNARPTGLTWVTGDRESGLWAVSGELAFPLERTPTPGRYLAITCLSRPRR